MYLLLPTSTYEIRPSWPRPGQSADLNTPTDPAIRGGCDDGRCGVERIRLLGCNGCWDLLLLCR